ncbi:MAG: alpha-amylase family glycosyl hydrolase [Janthinobacterium lividum]
MQGQTPDGSSYHGYWQNNINALNTAFGSASDLKALSAAVHAKGMYLMVDVAPNHFAWPGAYNTVDYSTYTPFNNKKYFHQYCPMTDYDYESNQTAVEEVSVPLQDIRCHTNDVQCWLGDSNVELTDVDTSRQDVINLYYAWIKNLVSTYSIDGLRIDTAKHIQQPFWPGFNTAAGVYCVGEVADGDPNYSLPYQNYLDGILNYPLYYPLLRAFQSTTGSMSDLVAMVNTIKSGAKDSTLLGNFIENHDNPRCKHYPPTPPLPTARTPPSTPQLTPPRKSPPTRATTRKRKTSSHSRSSPTVSRSSTPGKNSTSAGPTTHTIAKRSGRLATTRRRRCTASSASSTRCATRPSPTTPPTSRTRPGPSTATPRPSP